MMFQRSKCLWEMQMPRSFGAEQAGSQRLLR